MELSNQSEDARKRLKDETLQKILNKMHSNTTLSEKEIFIAEVSTRKILHLNYRKGFSTWPEELNQFGSEVEEIFYKENGLETLPEDIEMLTNLSWFSLEGNKLMTLPEGISRMKKLSTLHLKKNLISELPENIGELKTLEELCVEGNLLEDLPCSLGELSNLERLNLNTNQFTHVPKCILRLPKLRSLNLSYNRLESLPEEIGELPKLSVVSVSHNRLKRLPNSVTKLTRINAAANDLHFLPSLPFRAVHNEYFCGDNNPKISFIPYNLAIHLFDVFRPLPLNGRESAPPPEAGEVLCRAQITERIWTLRREPWMKHVAIWDVKSDVWHKNSAPSLRELSRREVYRLCFEKEVSPWPKDLIHHALEDDDTAWTLALQRKPRVKTWYGFWCLDGGQLTPNLRRQCLLGPSACCTNASCGRALFEAGALVCFSAPYPRLTRFFGDVGEDLTPDTLWSVIVACSGRCLRTLLAQNDKLRHAAENTTVLQEN